MGNANVSRLRCFDNRRTKGARLTTKQRFWSKVQRGSEHECWPWTAGTTTHGYGNFSLGGRAGRMHHAHRVAYELEFGAIPKGMSILHSCDNTLCVNPYHLRPGAQEENMRDMASRERTNTTKLTAAKVLSLRSLYREGATQRELARRFGVSQSNVQMIVTRRTWRHLP